VASQIELNRRESNEQELALSELIPRHNARMNAAQQKPEVCSGSAVAIGIGRFSAKKIRSSVFSIAALGLCTRHSTDPSVPRPGCREVDIRAYQSSHWARQDSPTPAHAHLTPALSLAATRTRYGWISYLSSDVGEALQQNRECPIPAVESARYTLRVREIRFW